MMLIDTPSIQMDTDGHDTLRKALHAKVKSSFLFGLLTYIDVYQESMKSD